MASLLKTAVIATTAAVVATAATLTLSTTAPSPVLADIPPAVLAQNTPPGQTPSLAPMLKTVLPSIVNIAVTAKVEVQQQNPLLNDPFFRRFFNAPNGPGGQQQQRPQTQEAQAIGSGVIVDAANGYVVTNNHVVDQADSIKVRLSDDREFTAKLIGKDPDTDLAVLQIKAPNLKQLPLADSDKAEVGDFVVAIGSPFNLRQTVTSGIISGLSRTGLGDGVEDFIQTDASINPGNSGGGLITLKGELVGINSQILSRSGGSLGIGFAIPSNIVKSVMTQLISKGKVTRGLIGISGTPLTPKMAKAFNLPEGRGVLVQQTIDDSPAAKADIKPGDIITKANGHDLTDSIQLRNIVRLLEVGDKVKLTVLRDGKPREVTLVIGNNEEEAKVDSDDLYPALKGASFAALADKSKSFNGKGVQITAVEQNSPAASSGLQPGDIVASVNRQPITSIAEFKKLAGDKSAQLLLQIQRGRNLFFVLLDPTGADQ